MKIFFSYKPRMIDYLGQVNIFFNDDIEHYNRQDLVNYFENLQPAVVISQNVQFLQKLAEIYARQHSNSIRLIALSAPESGIQSQIEFFALSEIELLQLLESQHTASLPVINADSAAPADADIVLVGAGAVNLMTAYYLHQQGYRIAIYDAQPEPYDKTRWYEYGTTLAGKDGRIFSFNESRHHHFKGNPASCPDNTQYQRTVSEGGWLITPRDSLTDLDRGWIDTYELLPQWLFEKIDQQVIAFNKESYQQWQQLMTEAPSLFENVGHINRLFRLYTRPASFKKAIAKEKKIGSIQRVLDFDDIHREFPCFKDAFVQGAIAGMLEVHGFSVNIHRFSLKLIHFLQSVGVSFFWNCPVNKIIFDASGTRVEALRTTHHTITGDYFVISPGVPRNDFLAGTRSHRQIGAMLGTWLTISNQDGLRFPLKISRTGYASEECAAGANIIPGIDEHGNEVLHIGAGHGFLGLNAQNIHEPYVRDLSRTVHETTRRLFPATYAREIEGTEQSLRFCIRPWTASCLGLFEVLPTVNDGKFILTGGHNTGGFAHSPAVATAVVNSLRGLPHPMHQLYHPERLHRFFEIC